MMDDCKSCRYRNRTVLQAPCDIGSYQILYSERCFCFKPLRWWQRAIDGIKAAQREEGQE